MSDFVGRAGELSRLRAELELAKAGTPRTVVVKGPAGIGKSALVGRFVDQAEVGSVLRAGGDESEARLSCGLITQLLASAPSAVGQLEQCGDPLMVGAALLRLFAELEARGPLLLVVEDAQWADPHSMQALSFALRRLQVDPVLTVVTVRDEPEDLLVEGLQRVALERGTVLRLGGLSCAELGELAVRVGVGHLPARALERLRAHTDGSPIHARTLLEELPGHVLRRGDGPLPAPRSFSLLVLSRLAGCSEAARRLVEAASVLGLGGDLGLAARMADLDDPAGPLDEATGAGLVEVQETATELAVVFTHGMVRAAVYDNLGRARRSTLHAAASALLPAPASLEHRAAAALVHDAALAGELLTHAQQESLRGDSLSAARHLLLSARLDPDRIRRERHLLDAAELLLHAGDVVGATALAEPLAELPESPRRAYILGHLALASGRQQEAEHLLREAWEGADPAVDPNLRVLASEQLADLCAAQVRPEETITWARRALEDDPGNDRGASALTTLVVYLALVGRPGEALPLVASMAVDAGNPTPRAVAGVLARGTVRLWMGEANQARTDLASVLAATCRTPAARPRLTALGFLAQAEYQLGQWPDSMRHAALAVSLASDGGQTGLLPFLHATAVPALAARGDWDEAEAHARSATEAAMAVGDALSLGYAYDAEARLASSREQHERVVEVCRRLSALPGQAVLAEPGVLVWRELLVEALVSLGRLGEATSVIAELDEHLEARPRRRLATATVTRVRGRLQAAHGAVDAARHTFENGLALHETLEAPFERALIQLAYGQMLRRAGERKEATTQLRPAQATFTALDARPFSDRAQRELAACGLSPRPRTVAPRVELTPQELAVAKLVVDGRTNREVSEALIVSPKTVEYHLRNIFTKLGITSRHQLRDHLGRP